MAKVDFKYIGKGETTIYKNCFHLIMKAMVGERRPRSDVTELTAKTELIFFFLIEEGKKNGFNTDRILEIPTVTGGTCFSIASYCCEQVSNYILDRRIKVNSINTKMMIPDFQFARLVERMLKKGVNPHIVNHTGRIQLEDSISRFNFESDQAKRLLSESPRSINLRSIHFAVENIVCSDTCPPDCPSQFEKFYYRNGSLIDMSSNAKIGSGGFGMVYQQLFHGKPKAMKCVWVGAIDDQTLLDDGLSDLEKNIAEIRIQMATSGSGVMVPEAFVRQQNQEKDENGKWIAMNLNIFIYPLYDCNLSELHENHYKEFTEDILKDIMLQCFTRKSSNSRFKVFNYVKKSICRKL